jgi:hypothetical protein
MNGTKGAQAMKIDSVRKILGEAHGAAFKMPANIYSEHYNAAWMPHYRLRSITNRK